MTAPKFSSQDLIDHQARLAQIDEFIEAKAREFAAVTNRATPITKDMTFDGYEFWDHDETITVTFGERWRHGGYEGHSVKMPLTALDSDMADEAAKALKAAQEEREAKEIARNKREKANRKAEYERLKKEFEA